MTKLKFYEKSVYLLKEVTKKNKYDDILSGKVG